MYFNSFTKISLFVHILAGFIGILFFWMLVFKKKGTALHQKIGLVFYYSLNVVCCTSILNGIVYLVADTVFQQKSHPHFGYGAVMILQGLISILPAYYGQFALKSIQTLPDPKTLWLHLRWLSILVVYVVSNQIYSINNFLVHAFYV